MARALLIVIAVLALAPAAGAYRLNDGVTPQPKLLYYVTVKDWRKPIARVVRALNRAHVGVKLVKTDIQQNAPIQFGRYEKDCGLPGVEATTYTLDGGYSAVYLPRGCKRVPASIIAAHEIGHALGLAHEDRRCALMNSSGTGAQSIPTNCLGRRINWVRHPFRKDDLKGLRKLYRNTPPKVRLKLTGKSATTVGFNIRATDREDNLSTITVDYGDGSRQQLIAGEALPTSHTYAQSGTYTLRVTGRDFYRKRGTAKLTVSV